MMNGFRPISEYSESFNVNNCDTIKIAEIMGPNFQNSYMSLLAMNGYIYNEFRPVLSNWSKISSNMSVSNNNGSSELLKTKVEFRKFGKFFRLTSELTIF